MNVLVTGMTASQTRGENAIAEHIVDALRDSGHIVQVGKPSLARTLDGERWDHVFVGLGPLHGLGTSSMYGALGVIGAHWDKCTLYLDDLDSGKIGSGFRVMRNKPERLIKPFYVYKREHELAVLPEVHAHLMSVITTLLETDEWPRLLVPAFGDDAFKTGQRITSAAGHAAVPVDYSAYVPDLSEAFTGDPGEPLDELWWATEGNPHAKAVRDLRPAWAVYGVEAKTLQKAMNASGFLLPESTWSARFRQFTDVGIPIGCSWRFTYDRLPDEFGHLLADIENMSEPDRKLLAKEQRTAFYSRMPSKEDIQKLVFNELH